MNWYIYELGPIDHYWQHMKTVVETAKELGAASAAAQIAGFPEDTDGESVSVSEFLAKWKDASSRVTSSPDELRLPPVVFWVPWEGYFKYGFVIKHDNNGTTYVVSPVELPHLGEAS